MSEPSWDPPPEPAAFTGPAAPEVSAQPRYWSPWASLWLSVAAMVTYFLLQGLGAALFVAISAFADGGVIPEAEEIKALLLAEQGLALSISLIFAAPVATLLVVLFTRTRGPGLALYLGLEGFTLKQFFGWTAAVIAFLVSFDLLGQSLDRPPVPDYMLDVFRTAGSLPLLYVALAVMAPLFEEILFRGFLLPSLAVSPAGKWGAVIVTALIWTAVHIQYDLFDLSAIFLLGVAFGWIRLATGSTYLTMAIHALINLVATWQVGLEIASR